VHVDNNVLINIKCTRAISNWSLLTIASKNQRTWVLSSQILPKRITKIVSAVHQPICASRLLQVMLVVAYKRA